MVKTVFRDATLFGTNLRSANMKSATFRNADLRRANLGSGVLEGASLRDANLCGANLRSAIVRRATFRDADLTKADLKSATGCTTATFTAGTTFCGTRMCDGSIRNDDCPGGPPADLCCADCGPGEVCRGDACCVTDLALAVGAADDGDILLLCAGTFRTVNVSIGKDLTIIGTGTGADGSTLDAEDDGRVLEIAGGAEVTLEALKITGGKTNDPDGGGILNNGTLTLRGVAVSGNTGAQGGGLRNNGTLTLGDGAVVSGNTAGNVGGGIFNEGTLTLEDGSEVSGNGAADGGGIFHSGSSLALLEAGSRVTGNDAFVDGGGFYRNGSPPVTVEDTSIITGNTADRNGDNCAPVGSVPNCLG
jgi:hypothetical protein